MEEELKKEKTIDNQFLVFMFLVIGLTILIIMLAVVFFDSVWIPALLTAASMMIATVVYIQLDMRNKIPWTWALGSFLVIPILYFIIAAVVSQ